jgi:hypothetical protein
MNQIRRRRADSWLDSGSVEIAGPVFEDSMCLGFGAGADAVSIGRVEGMVDDPGMEWGVGTPLLHELVTDLEKLSQSLQAEGSEGVGVEGFGRIVWVEPEFLGLLFGLIGEYHGDTTFRRTARSGRDSAGALSDPA